MSFLGDIERFVAEDLYPYRWFITIGLAAAIAAGLAFAYSRGWHMVVWRHKLASAIVAVAVLAVAIPAGNYLLSPLWERSFLEEASPLAAAAGEITERPDASLETPPANQEDEPAADSGGSEEPSRGGAETPASDFEPQIVSSGEVEGADAFHFGEGTALLIETAPGEYTLRFEDFSVRNGPDLFVYLSPDPDGYAEGALNLGELKATDGAFNYEVPPGTDISQFKSAIVWCKAFSVLFATATLSEP